MNFIADFHIHSHYSIATSKNLIPEYLELWAKIKGINVIGTGDCIHPGWYQELKEKFEPAFPTPENCYGHICLIFANKEDVTQQSNVPGP